MNKLTRRTLLLLVFHGLLFGAFTEFYCDNSTGSNLNGGAPIGGIYPKTYASGSWVAATGVFTVASGDPASDGITVGDFASVYADGASAPTGFVGRVTARDATTITVSLTAASGSAPTDGTNTRTIVVGGAWKGPNAGSGFPVSFAKNVLMDASSNIPRINMKNTSDYTVTLSVAQPSVNPGPIWIQGYSSTVGDGGRFVLDGGTNDILILSLAGQHVSVLDGIIKSSATTGNNACVRVLTSSGKYLKRLVAIGARGAGFLLSIAAECVELEAYNCNKANTVNTGGIHATPTGGVVTLTRCISHHHTGSNAHGFQVTGETVLTSPVAYSNGGSGMNVISLSQVVILGGDLYNNTADGITIANPTALTIYIENTNLVKNGGWGIKGTGAGGLNGEVVNCGFGSGTQANSSGTTTGLKSMVESGSINYPSNVTPWVDPVNGDFRINLVQAMGTGRGSFTETAPSYSGTIGYPDIGAAQHKDTGTGTAFASYKRRERLREFWGFNPSSQGNEQQSEQPFPIEWAVLAVVGMGIGLVSARGWRK